MRHGRLLLLLLLDGGDGHALALLAAGLASLAGGGLVLHLSPASDAEAELLAAASASVGRLGLSSHSHLDDAATLVLLLPLRRALVLLLPRAVGVRLLAVPSLALALALPALPPGLLSL